MNLLQRIIAVLVCTLLMAGLTACGSSTDSKVTTLKAAMSDFPNGGLLVSGDSLKDSLGVKGLIVIDARSATAYNAGHIPGAINVLWSDYRDAAAMGLKDTATLATQLGAQGITRDATIVIYDDTVASWGAAGRIFWMLDYLGCSDIHILNGGWDKWVADGKPTETTPAVTTTATFTPATNLRTDIAATKFRIMNRLGDSDFVVLDTRKDEEYLGWQLYGETRPGHIKGAINLPYAWYYNSADKTVLDYKKLKSLFDARGVTSDKEVIAYCTAGIRSAHAYFLMRLMGYTRCSNYDGSIKEWAATTPQLPMEYAQNYQLVVYPDWVKSLISGTNPPTFPTGNNFKIFECSWGPTSSAYNAGHIPGSIHFDTNTVEARNHLDPTNPFPVSDANEVVWDLVSDSMLQARLAAMGVSNTTTVIVYGKGSAATRVYWALRYAGVDVRYLNGGLTEWKANGGAIETAANTPTQATFVINPRPQIKALTPEIKAYADYFRTNSTQLATTALVDVRTIQEYTGEVLGYNDPVLSRKGRIPGAIWGYEAAKPYYQDEDDTLRSYTEVRDIWKTKGITSDKTVIFYCGTGWRSTLSFLYADLMGWPNIKNYDSWYVWSTFYELSTNKIHYEAPFNDPAMPIDTGWPQ